MKNLPHCIDCNKELKTYKSKRCRKCFYIYHNKIIKGKYYGKKGTQHPNYKHGKYTKDYKEYCIDCGKEISVKHKRCRKCGGKYISLRQKGKNNPMYGRTGRTNPHFGKVTSWKYIQYKKYFMHSSWEVAYAKYLDKNNIKWQYESKTFDLGDTTYTPDFYLPETDKYIEIKGYWGRKSLNKLIATKLLYPDTKIEILEKNNLKELEVL
jgi:ribosomal protein L40E